MAGGGGGGGSMGYYFVRGVNSISVREEMLKRNLPDKEQLLHKNDMNVCINCVFDFPSTYVPQYLPLSARNS